ncbi:dipeptidase [Streptomyces sp. NPDC047928]|uniref:dipeptidase n=1 Tax=unclassified Streptomyces TaxID=2593676 RepID=UPI00371F1F4D
MADLQDHPYDPSADPPASAVGELDGPSGAAEPPAEAPAADRVHHDRAHALLGAHPVIDGHNTLAQELLRTHWPDLERGESSLDTDIPRIRAGGVGAQFWSLLPAPDEGDEPPRTLTRTLERIDVVRRLIASCPENLRLALTAGCLSDARSCGRVASLLGPVSGPALGDSIGTLRAYHALGVRSANVAGARWAADGLTGFGQEVVREMNRLGILVDLSGASAETMRHVLAVSDAPVICSRSAAHALTPHPANVPDDILLTLRANGGVCMVSFAPEQVARPPQPATLKDVADHLDHVREVAGSECVGLSGTYGMAVHAPHTLGLEDASCYPNLIAELLRRDWSDTDVAALTWQNAARAVRETELVARAATLGTLL